MCPIRKKLKQIKLLNDIYQKKKYMNKIKCRYTFENRSKGSKYLCIVLAGYKEFSYEAVFGRLVKYALDGMDFCVITSGKFSDVIQNICKEQNWSYLSTEINNVALVQNLAISLHPNAEYIFKLDEDIFITKEYFSKMIKAFQYADNNLPYKIGFISPIIPINGIGYKIILDELNLNQTYTSQFETPFFDTLHSKIFKDPNVAEFFWGKGGFVPQIDDLNKKFEKYENQTFVVPMRFSIGAILFKRSFFEEMGMFDVDRRDTNMGKDEVQLCHYCEDYGKVMLIALNIVVGHLSFGSQNKEMQNYYQSNVDMFLPN